jgi:hypothetical protein
MTVICMNSLHEQGFHAAPARGRMRESTKFWALIFGEHKINANFGAVNFLSLWRSIQYKNTSYLLVWEKEYMPLTHI